MSDEQDLHTETESEDGGVPVSGFGTAPVDISSGTTWSSNPTSPISDQTTWPSDLVPSSTLPPSQTDPQNSLAHVAASMFPGLEGTHFSSPDSMQPPDGVIPDGLLESFDFSNLGADLDNLAAASNHSEWPVFYLPEDLEDGLSDADEDALEVMSMIPSFGDLYGPFSPDDPLLPTIYDPSHSHNPGLEHDPLQPPYPAFAQQRQNFTCDEFFLYWKEMYTTRIPGISSISGYADKPKCQKHKSHKRSKKLSAKDMVDEKADMQGIYWSRFQTTREQAREVRRRTYRNHINMEENNPTLKQEKENFGTPAFKVSFQSATSPRLPYTSERYFRFKEMKTKYKPQIRHYQLHHNLSASSSNAVFYYRYPESVYMNPATGQLQHNIKWGIMCVNPIADTEMSAMDASKIHDKDAPRVDDITTLSAANGVIVAGDMQGIYGLKSLATSFESEITTGTIVPTHTFEDTSTNHVHTMLGRRSGLPQAVFTSNDKIIRVLDCHTNKWLGKHKFRNPVNCSCTSPDGRLRLLVSDDATPIVANAETGEILAELPGHTDHGFACAWAPDGITMATGHQDGIVQIWDARKMTKAIHSIPAEMSGVRALEFSPLGSGKPVLALAESSDFVSIVDANTFQSKQTIEFFGEIVGITMSPDGSSLFIGNSDPTYGGITEFERTANSSVHSQRRPRTRRVRDIDDSGDTADHVRMEDVDRYGDADMARNFSRAGFPWREHYSDWFADAELEMNAKTVRTRAHRWRRNMGLGGLLL